MSFWISDNFTKGLVSVIIPTYNRKNLLQEALGSVKNQNYRPIECVVVDDGSTDDTTTFMEQWIIENQTLDFQIKYIKKQNGGAPAARNLGTENSTGEFIQYLDSDDLLYAEKLKVQVAFLNSNPNYDGVFGDWHHGTETEYDLVKGSKNENLIAQFYGVHVIHTLSFLYRRALVAKVGPWDIDLKRNQEVDFNLRAVLAKGNFEYVPLLTGLWREHPGERIVSSNGAKHALKYYYKWIAKFQEMDIFDRTLKEISAMFLFTKSLELELIGNNVPNILYEVDELDPTFSYFNTYKMKILKRVMGRKKAIDLWYRKYLKQKKYKLGL